MALLLLGGILHAHAIPIAQRAIEEKIDFPVFCYYNNCMEIEFDQSKCNMTLQQRGLDFARACEVFSGVVVTIDDIRRDYGEPRYITVGLLDCRAVVLVWTPRGDARRIISMRYANDREKSKYSKHLDRS